MPELPEVETIKRDLEAGVAGLTINAVEVLDKRVIKDLSVSAFISRLKSRRIESVSRRGKALVMTFAGRGYLVVQLKMTGQLVYHRRAKDAARTKDTKAVFLLSDGGCLFYNDQRTFGWLIAVDDLASVPYLQTIGPEPLLRQFNPASIRAALKQRTAPIKPLLMNQDFVAGIGNIYASEILFRAGIHPGKRSSRLTHKEVVSLHRATVKILREAIARRGSSVRNYRDGSGEKGTFNSRIKVYGRKDESCVACREPIRRIVQSGRSTFFCAHCQS